VPSASLKAPAALSTVATTSAHANAASAAPTAPAAAAAPSVVSAAPPASRPRPVVAAVAASAASQNQPESKAPVSKAPVAKGPVAKAPVAKVPAAKAPVAKVVAASAAKAPISKVPAAKPSVPAPPQPKAECKPVSASSPGPSPSSSGGGDDQLYTLIGELAEDPVISGGELNEARLEEVLRRLWDGAARKPKDWATAWQNMGIPVEKQAEALQKFLNMAFSQGDSQRAPMVIADLVKAHRLKMRSVEEVLVTCGQNLDGVLAMHEDAWHVYAHFLMHVFPKSAQAGWGWSRVGWSWASWFKFAEQCIQSLSGERASDTLCMILRLIQEREGTPISEVQSWSDGDKLSKFVAKIAELGESDLAEAAEKLGQQGVVVQI